MPAEFAALSRRGEDYVEKFKKTANIYLDEIESISNQLARDMGETSRTSTRLSTNRLIEDVGRYVTGADPRSLKKLNPNLAKFEEPLNSLKRILT